MSTERRILVTCVVFIVVAVGTQGHLWRSLTCTNLALVVLGTAMAERAGDTTGGLALQAKRLALQAVDSNRSLSGWSALGFSQLLLGDEGAALAAWRNTDHPEQLMLTRGHLARSTSENELARKWYQLAIQLDPELGDSWFSLASLEEEQGSITTALYHYTVAANATRFTNSNRATAHFHMGRLLYNQKHYAAASAEFLSALVNEDLLLDTELIETHFYLGEAARESHFDTHALEEYTWVVHNAPKEHWTMYWAYVHGGYLQFRDPSKWSIAEAWLVKATTLRPDLKWAYLRIGQLHKLRSELEAARNAFRQVLSLDPNDEVARSALSGSRVR